MLTLSPTKAVIPFGPFTCRYSGIIGHYRLFGYRYRPAVLLVKLGITPNLNLSSFTKPSFAEPYLIVLNPQPPSDAVRQQKKIF